MSTFDLLPELAAQLDRLVPPEQVAGDWSDVLRRVAPSRRPRSALRARRLALLAGALILLLVAVATAMHLLRHRETVRRPQSGALTVTAGGYNARWPVKIIEVLPRGRTVVIWRCPVLCGEPEGVDWSPDGRHVAFTVDAFNTTNDPAYLGLHVLDVQTGRDTRLLGEYSSQSHANCATPGTVAWSPDGQTLAYDCAAFGERSRIWLVAADGSHTRRLPTGKLNASWPSWSPDSTRIAFAANGVIYTARLDGTGLRQVVAHGSAPDWSPNGREIAYSAKGGVRLVTPAGRDVTPRRSLGPAGAPAWSPDGRELAVALEGGSGLYLVDLTGRHRRRLGIRGDVGSIGPRPAWYPVIRTPSSSPATTPCPAC